MNKFHIQRDQTIPDGRGRDDGDEIWLALVQSLALFNEPSVHPFIRPQLQSMNEASGRERLYDYLFFILMYHGLYYPQTIARSLVVY